MANDNLGSVLCIGTHPVDLDDGRTLAPGDPADNVDTMSAHNRDLVLSGHLKVVEGTTPRKRASQQAATAQAAQAARPQEDDDK